jgi:phage gpG-like protein
VRVEVDVIGVPTITAKLKNMAGRMSNISPAWNDVADYMMDITETTFEAQGRPRWRPLSEKWLTFKIKHGLDPRILHMSGALRRSVTRRRARGQVLIIRPHELEFGTSLEYAATHQFGRGPIPRRQFLKVTPGERRVMREMIEEYLMIPWRRTGIPAFGGGEIMRGPGGRFVGVSRG